MSAEILPFAHRGSPRRHSKKVISAHSTFGHLLDPKDQIPIGPSHATAQPADRRPVAFDQDGHLLIRQPSGGHPVAERHVRECAMTAHRCQEACAVSVMDVSDSVVHIAHMAKKSEKSESSQKVNRALMATFLRAWRDFRGFTLEDAASKIGLTHGNLSKRERGLVSYKQEDLESLAILYKCQPWQLLIQNPTDQTWIYKFYHALSAKDQKALLGIAESERAKEEAGEQDSKFLSGNHSAGKAKPARPRSVSAVGKLRGSL